MYDFKQICNIAFIYKVAHKATGDFVFPAVYKQLGKTWNYVVICLDDKWNGVYKWDPNLIPDLQVWHNNKLPCYVLPVEDLIKIKNIEDLSPELPLGKYILKIVRKIRDANN